MCSIFFFNAPATTEIYTLSLHDALPIYQPGAGPVVTGDPHQRLVDRRTLLHEAGQRVADADRDRKSTRLNSSHVEISYAVFCLKKKKKKKTTTIHLSTPSPSPSDPAPAP